jgi:hypothetical protein
MIKKATILVEIISTLGALASILWLFLDPGPEPFAASLVCLAVILGIGVQAQIKLSKIQDDALSERLSSIREFIHAIDDIPRLTAEELEVKLKNDSELCKSLTSRLVSIFGLRREYIPYIEQELIDLIDNEFQQFYDIGVGSYKFNKEKIHEFAIFSEKLAKTVRDVEKKLIADYRKRFKS